MATGWHQIILLGDGGTRINNLTRVALSSAAAGNQTCDRNSGSLTAQLLIAGANSFTGWMAFQTPNSMNTTWPGITGTVLTTNDVLAFFHSRTWTRPRGTVSGA